MAEDDVVRFFKVVDVLRDRLMFLLMLRCGLRVGEVSTLTWPAVNFHARSICIDNSKGQVDWVVYYSPDVEHALGFWRLSVPITRPH
jgi:integrase